MRFRRYLGPFAAISLVAASCGGNGHWSRAQFERCASRETGDLLDLSRLKYMAPDAFHPEQQLVAPQAIRLSYMSGASVDIYYASRNNSTKAISHRVPGATWRDEHIVIEVGVNGPDTPRVVRSIEQCDRKANRS